MSLEPKQPATPEKSLSYIAWSLKEISENMKKMTNLMTEQVEASKSRKDGSSKRTIQDEIPF